MVSRLALTRVFPTGKIWSQRHAAAARNRLRPDAVSIGALATIARAQGGVMRHVKPTACCTTRRRKKHNWQTPSPDGIRLRSGIDSRWAGRKRADCAGKQYGLTTREEVFADRGYRLTARWCREVSQAR